MRASELTALSGELRIQLSKQDNQQAAKARAVMAGGES